ncbi:hypothetical protein HDU76_013299 [Blyttiomyces sp. JEL0837]|nr:hypothetical protein HDU76_013299 [Blyttiomyces sp. JEL0837]
MSAIIKSLVVVLAFSASSAFAAIGYPADCSACADFGKTLSQNCAMNNPDQTTANKLATCMCPLMIVTPGTDCGSCITASSTDSSTPATKLFTELAQACKANDITAATNLIAPVIQDQIKINSQIASSTSAAATGNNGNGNGSGKTTTGATVAPTAKPTGNGAVGLAFKSTVVGAIVGVVAGFLSL